MESLEARTQKMRYNVVLLENPKKYALVTNLSRSWSSAGIFPSGLFRIFTRLRRNRKLNPLYGESFDIYRDNLMDFPTISQSKIGGSWRDYNDAMCVQVGWCNLNCWYCYVEECLRSACDVCVMKGDRSCKKWVPIKPSVTADMVIDALISTLRAEQKERGILRITGGEPFLIPDFILECLEEIKKRGLEKKILVWAETNLTPFLPSPDEGEPIIEAWEVEEGHSWRWRDLAKFENFCLHPCLHGVDTDSFKRNTGFTISNFGRLLEGLEMLLRAGISIYPSIGMQVTPPNKIESFFGQLMEIDPYLPLLVAVRDYDFAYEPVLRRLERLTSNRQMKQSTFKVDRIYNKTLVVMKWNALLEKHLGRSYAEMPRHLVTPLTSIVATSK